MEQKHASHVTRSSDSSLYDEVCTKCGATDEVPGGWGKLARPCPKQETESNSAFIERLDGLWYIDPTELDKIYHTIFKHDMLITLSGDFGSEEEQTTYLKAIRDKLNRAD